MLIMGAKSALSYLGRNCLYMKTAHTAGRTRRWVDITLDAQENPIEAGA